MKQTGAEIIAVGTEILLGQISDTNGQWLSEQLAARGINVYYHTVVGDNLDRVEHVFEKAHKRSDIIIVCGGLGPTVDDMTREAFQKLSGIPLKQHEPSLDKIKAFYQQKKVEMTPNNIRQARVFEGARIFLNSIGMAPGMALVYEGKVWIFLPGVPKEMKAMVNEEVLPYLNRETGSNSVIDSEMMHFMGIGESALEHQLRDIIDRQSNPTIAPLAQTEGVGIRLTAKAANKQEAQSAIEETKTVILEKAGDYYIGSNHGGLKAKVFHLLKSQNESLAAAESLTGGLFSDGIISQPGASNVFRGGLVCYDKQIKTDVLHVSSETLAEKGAVSPECAAEMAENIRDLMSARVGIGFTGNAGPDAVEEKPVGMVYIGIHGLTPETEVELFHFGGDRNVVRRKAVTKGYEMLYKMLVKS